MRIFAGVNSSSDAFKIWWDDDDHDDDDDDDDDNACGAGDSDGK